MKKFKKQTQKQTISDILYNLEIIKKKVERNKYTKDQLSKLDFDLFLWTGGKSPYEKI